MPRAPSVRTNSRPPLPFSLLPFFLLLLTAAAATAAAATAAASLNPQHVLSPAARRTASDCTPVSTTGKLSADHSAHAVPGVYPPAVRRGTPSSYVDSDGDGFYVVDIDGRRSHTHFFDPARNIAGRLIRATWTDVATNVVLSRSLKFTRKFPVGVTKLSLTVVDNACNVHTAVTTVTVTSRFQPGVYCYTWADRKSFILPSVPVGRVATPPTFASQIRGLWWNANMSPFRNLPYVVRCFFRIRSKQARTGTFSVSTVNPRRKEGTGHARLYSVSSSKPPALVLSSSVTKIGSKSFTLKQGENAFELQYLYSEISVFPNFVVYFDDRVPPARDVTYDRFPIVPVLRASLPATVPVSGGRVRLVGYGLYRPLRIRIGSAYVKPIPSDGLSTEVYVRVPPLTAQPNSPFNDVDVQVISATKRRSNVISLTYVNSACDAPAFDPGHLSMPSASASSSSAASNDSPKEPVKLLKQPTCATLGPDRRIYVGTLTGTVAVLGYHPVSHIATTYCTSEPLMDPRLKSPSGEPVGRAILGIAFDPTTTNSRRVGPYVSTSTLNFWSDDRVSLDQPEAWYNGGVDRMYVYKPPGMFSIKPGDDNSDGPLCVRHDKRIVSGLPVANGGSHSINHLQFTRDGDLLIAVGGTTNMGLPGHRLGNIWGAPLSGAVIIARLSRNKKFDGTVRYRNAFRTVNGRRVPAPDTARVISGDDVQVWASGMRNLYTFTETLDGDLYGVDQGPGCPLGGAAISCNDYNAKRAASWPVLNNTDERDWPSQVSGSDPTCPGIRREDKLILLQQGKYYGHANLPRGECTWIDPLTDLAADGKTRPPRNYVSPLTMFPASATSVAEYHAVHFCEAMRGDLVVSTFRGVQTWRYPLKSAKAGVVPRMFSTGEGNPELLALGGGISFVEDHFGTLVFPRLTTKDVGTLVPRAPSTPATDTTVVGVWPRVLPRSGGAVLYVGGVHFDPRSSVTVGGARCETKVRTKDGREIQCVVPPKRAGTKDDEKLDVVVTNNSGRRCILTEAVIYTLK